jgi:PAS domain S-box-containing protein
MTATNDGENDSTGSSTPATGSGQALRQRAEEKARGMGTENLEALAPDKARRLLHELQVHQIELEMQNDELRRAQQELALSRDRYFDFYNFAPVGYLTVSEEGLIREVNLTAASMLHVERAHLLQRPLSRFIVTEDQEIYYRYRKQLFETGTPQACEMRMVRQGGNPFWARLEATVAQDEESGAPVCRVVMSDITERKQAEGALRQERDLLNRIAETSPTGIITTNSLGQIIYANVQAERILGLTRDAISQRNYNAPEWRITSYDGQPFPDDELPFRCVMTTGQPVFDVGHAIEWPDGRRVLLSINAAPLFDSAGQLDGIVASIADVTERKRAEEALRESEAQLRAVLDATPFPIALVDVQDNNIEFWSRSALTLFGHTAPTAPEWYQIAYPDPDYQSDVLERWKPFMEKAQQSAQAVNAGEYRVTCRDGSVRICELYAAFLPDRLIVTFNDITERKRAEEEGERLLATEHEQRLRAETLAEVTLALASQLDRQAVLDEILRQAQRLVPFSTANIALLEGDTLRTVHWRGYEMAGAKEFMLGLVQPLSDFFLDADAVRLRKALFVPDTQQEPRWVPLDETAWIRSYLTLPLCLGEQVLGLLRLDSDLPGRFSDADAERLQPLANAAAIALENARLYDQARRDAETKATLLREVNHRVLNNLSALIGLLDVEARQAEAEGRITPRPLIQNLISRVNGLAAVHSLLSAAEWQPLELSDLAGRVIHASQQMLPRDKQVVIDVAPSPVRVTPDQAQSLALVVNELAINTVKHALAGRDRAHITVRISRQDDTLALEFRDDGPGYPEEVIQFKRHRVGVYLLQNLVRSNLRGELLLYNDDGAVAAIRFPARA